MLTGEEAERRRRTRQLRSLEYRVGGTMHRVKVGEVSENQLTGVLLERLNGFGNSIGVIIHLEMPTPERAPLLLLGDAVPLSRSE